MWRWAVIVDRSVESKSSGALRNYQGHPCHVTCRFRIAYPGSSDLSIRMQRLGILRHLGSQWIRKDPLRGCHPVLSYRYHHRLLCYYLPYSLKVARRSHSATRNVSKLSTFDEDARQDASYVLQEPKPSTRPCNVPARAAPYLHPVTIRKSPRRCWCLSTPNMKPTIVV
jgi:hypothetical protein